MLHFYKFKETDVFRYKIYHNFIKFVKWQKGVESHKKVA